MKALLAGLAVLVLARDDGGDGTDPALLWRQGLAAYAAGRLDEAELLAEKAAARGGARFEELRAFLFATTEYARAERIAERAARADADPELYTAALRLGERARDGWIAALERRGAWPEACRNVERAALALARWEAEREEARRTRQPEPPPLPPTPEDETTRPESQEEPGPLTAAEVERLRAFLRQKEDEKRLRRRAARQGAALTVEKDW